MMIFILIQFCMTPAQIITGSKINSDLCWLSFLWMCTHDWIYWNTATPFSIPTRLSDNTFSVLLMIQHFFPQNIAPGPRGVVCVVPAGQWAGADRVIIWLVLTPAGILRLWMKRPLWIVKNPLGMLKTHPRHEEPRKEGLCKNREDQSLCQYNHGSPYILSKSYPRDGLWNITSAGELIRDIFALLHVRTRAKTLKRYPWLSVKVNRTKLACLEAGSGVLKDLCKRGPLVSKQSKNEWSESVKEL